jgi:hypothetical protein
MSQVYPQGLQTVKGEPCILYYIQPLVHCFVAGCREEMFYRGTPFQAKSPRRGSALRNYWMDVGESLRVKAYVRSGGRRLETCMYVHTYAAAVKHGLASTPSHSRPLNNLSLGSLFEPVSGFHNWTLSRTMRFMHETRRGFDCLLPGPRPVPPVTCTRYLPIQHSTFNPIRQWRTERSLQPSEYRRLPKSHGVGLHRVCQHTTAAEIELGTADSKMPGGSICFSPQRDLKRHSPTYQTFGG